ncbi:hypothetical protein [Streptomonospora litoralis]|uniref:Uncharacterized protein n=1 Tax=Streptomonospora litoralis TaxID=2498135 RepID=A0A4P6Q9S3_9ACTN|nr:hypothetical protein [Streptomonospora litoralis]QBI55867.1 hypothetical protein EKD16_20540 [Streptomonospora litoralis]
MSERPRFTAGTRSLTSTLLHPVRTVWQMANARAAQEADLRDLNAGLPLMATAFVKSNRRYRQGAFVFDLDASEPVVWRKWRPFMPYGPPVALRGPFELGGFGPAPAQYQSMLQTTIRDASSVWEVMVTAADTELVAAALAEAGKARAGDESGA